MARTGKMPPNKAVERTVEKLTYCDSVRAMLAEGHTITEMSE